MIGDFIDPPRWLPVATDRIIGLSLIGDQDVHCSNRLITSIVVVDGTQFYQMSGHRET